LDDLKELDLEKIDINDFRPKYNDEINAVYQYDVVKKTVVSAIKNATIGATSFDRIFPPVT